MNSKETANLIAQLLDDKKAFDIKVIDVATASDLTDYFVICSGNSVSQVKALYEHIEAEMEKNGIFVIRKEGASEGRWIAMDYTDVIVHIFHKESRNVYALDKLWNSGSNVVDFN